MHKNNSRILGVQYFKTTRILDSRGFFSKTFNIKWNDSNPTLMAETFISYSIKGTIRGMHFQVGDHANDRIVSVIDGKVFDVLIDLRVSSPTFKTINTIEMYSGSYGSVFIPKGVAHGFQALENTFMLYLSSQIHDKKSDFGVNVYSLGISWPLVESIVSDRDLLLPNLDSVDLGLIEV